MHCDIWACYLSLSMMFSDIHRVFWFLFASSAYLICIVNSNDMKMEMKFIPFQLIYFVLTFLAMRFQSNSDQGIITGKKSTIIWYVYRTTHFHIEIQYESLISLASDANSVFASIMFFPWYLLSVCLRQHISSNQLNLNGMAKINYQVASANKFQLNECRSIS